MAKKVGLLGFGTIGKYLYKELAKDGVEIAFVYCTKEPQEKEVKDLFISTPEQLEAKCQEGVDLVIEAAVSKVVVEVAPMVLQYADFLAFSTTAFAEAGFEEKVAGICQQYNHAFHVPHGAILGLDGIFDGKKVLEKVTITTTKKPANLGREDKERTILYEGPTRGACKAYPRNVNVHASIAIAGLGFDKTISKIVSDPNAAGNTHHIEIEAEGCNFAVDVLSKPVSGVTGAYTPVSAYASAKRVLFKTGIVIA